ncbi:RNA-directed DNA polymerase, eukaryota, reverse transcriptase zinc-binding domain protein, partial [Tanacetum coccineum]
MNKPEDNINISNVEVERGHNGDKEEGEFVVSQNQDKIDTDIDANESTCSGHFKKSTRHRTGGSIIQLIEDLVNVGANDGYREKLKALGSGQKPNSNCGGWAVEGDENSKYYHGVINKKRNNLAIRGVLVDGNWVESPQLVKNEFYTHFKQRFEKPNLSGIQFDREFPNKICSEQAVDLEREVSKEEVKRAVWDCGTDKAPGPDGFTFGFYRRFWNLIECDVVNAVKWFFLHERIPSGGNSSFITLIPKVSNANMVKDFRPISLIGSVYKIVAKILANRLVLVLGDLVSDTQSAFLKERQILDGPFILNEMIQWCKKKKKQSMIFKVDFEKAYDSVRWDFFDTILKK